MNGHTPQKTTAWILANLLNMIEESSYFCEVFSHTLKAHHNPQAAKIFEHALGVFKQEEQLLQSAMQKIPAMDSIEIAPWHKPYPDYCHPASKLMEADYLMSEDASWRLVDQLAQVHLGFYSRIKSEQTTPELINLVSALEDYCLQCTKPLI